LKTKKSKRKKSNLRTIWISKSRTNLTTESSTSSWFWFYWCFLWISRNL